MVAAASREARRCGIRAGMPLAQAAIRCPDGTFLAGAIDDGFAAAQQVDELVRRETPDIEWDSIDELFAGLPDALGPTRAIAVAERLHRTIGELGFDVSCGVARSKLVARIASQLGRPRGVVHVLDGYEARFLSPLKVEMLPGVDLALARKLRAAGIRRLGQLARLTESQLASLIGRAGTSLRRQAAGIDPSRIKRTALPPARIKESELADATADPAILAGAIRRECERIGHDLRSRGVFARSITLRVRLGDGRVESRTAPLPEPTALDDALFAAAAELLPRLWNGERLVRAVGVSCTGLIAGSSQLFDLRRA
jgi:nucleotidyltransferase/DNA polymerase involved in DNA repair